MGFLNVVFDISHFVLCLFYNKLWFIFSFHLDGTKEKELFGLYTQMKLTDLRASRGVKAQSEEQVWTVSTPEFWKSLFMTFYEVKWSRTLLLLDQNVSEVV